MRDRRDGCGSSYGTPEGASELQRTTEGGTPHRNSAPRRRLLVSPRRRGWVVNRPAPKTGIVLLRGGKHARRSGPARTRCSTAVTSGLLTILSGGTWTSPPPDTSPVARGLPARLGLIRPAQPVSVMELVRRSRSCPRYKAKPQVRGPCPITEVGLLCHRPRSQVAVPAIHSPLPPHRRP